MDLQTLENRFTKNAIINAYDYLIGCMDVIVGVNRIWLVAHTDETKSATITYSIAPQACANLLFSDAGLSFSARFKGVSKNIYVPWHLTISIFCPELSVLSPLIHNPFGLSLEVKSENPYSESSEEVNQVSQEDKIVLEKRSKMKILPS